MTTTRLSDRLDELRAYAAVETDPARLDVLLRAIEAELAEWVPLDHQVPPPAEFYLWLLMGGRGSGKTDGCAEYMKRHAESPPCDPRLPGGHRMGIIAPTLGDSVVSCVNGPSGLKAHGADCRVVNGAGGLEVRFANGAEAKLFGAHTPDDAERLRAGGNRCLFWLEEFAAWRRLEEAWTNMRLGLRIGANPHAIGSTTPRNRPTIHTIDKRAKREARMLDAGETVKMRRRFVVTHATTDDNPHLPLEIREELYDSYGGTRLGRQELAGELLEDIGTIFQRQWFDLVDETPAVGVGWHRIRYWDLAGTEASEHEDRATTVASDDPDWTAGVLLAWHPQTRHLVIEHLHHVRRTPGKVQQLILAAAAEDGTQVPVWIEEEPGQSGKSQVATYNALLPGHIVKGDRPSGPKVVRAQLLAQLAEQGVEENPRGRVSVVAGPWRAALLDEMEDFDGTDEGHDDIVDACSGGLKVLSTGPTPGGGTSAEVMATMRPMRRR